MHDIIKIIIKLTIKNYIQLYKIFAIKIDEINIVETTNYITSTIILLKTSKCYFKIIK